MATQIFAGIEYDDELQEVVPSEDKKSARLSWKMCPHCKLKITEFTKPEMKAPRKGFNTHVSTCVERMRQKSLKDGEPGREIRKQWRREMTEKLDRIETAQRRIESVLDTMLEKMVKGGF